MLGHIFSSIGAHNRTNQIIFTQKQTNSRSQTLVSVAIQNQTLRGREVKEMDTSEVWALLKRHDRAPP